MIPKAVYHDLNYSLAMKFTDRDFQSDPSDLRGQWVAWERAHLNPFKIDEYIREAIHRISNSIIPYDRWIQEPLIRAWERTGGWFIATFLHDFY